MSELTLLADHLRAMAREFPDEVAYRVVGAGEMTFSQWNDESNRLARHLVDAGIEKGDRVGIYLEASEGLRWMVAYAAVHKAAAVAVPTNTRLTLPELERLYAHAEPRAIITGGSLVSGAGRLAHGLGSRGSPVRLLLESPEDSEGCDAWSWGKATAGRGPQELQVPVSGDDLADILYTSGTTGNPKGVAIRHRNAALIPGPPNPSYSGGSWLHASPLFTFAGIGFVYNPMQLGLFGVYMPRFDAGEWICLVQELRPGFVFLVPSMAQLVVAHRSFDGADLTSVQICAIGSAPLAPSTLRALQEKMPEASVSNSYGMTEAGAAFCAMPQGESLKRIGSVGKPVAPLEVRCVDEAGSDVPVGEVGEILLRMAGREREYFRDEAATSEMWRGGWLYSGDLGRFDSDGYLYIVGRKKDVIIRGGNNIHAVDVERVLFDHPDVLDAAVVGIPHPVLGEDVAAVVVCTPGAALTSDALRAHCAERLADNKVPRRIEFADELPRNATGKVLKAQLRESIVNLKGPQA